MSLNRKVQVLAVLLLIAVGPTWAHAILLAATPSANQVVAGGNVDVRLRFNSRIDAKRSRLVILGPDGRERPLAIDEQPSPDVLTAKPEPLIPGSYVLRWQVLAEDGHITRGEVPFTAH